MRVFPSRTHVTLFSSVLGPSSCQKFIKCLHVVTRTHTEWTGFLPHSLLTLSEADKLGSALEEIQRAQLSIL